MADDLVQTAYRDLRPQEILRAELGAKLPAIPVLRQQLARQQSPRWAIPLTNLDR